MTITTAYSGKTGQLTTDHAASSYGKPVLVMDGTVYGPADILPYWPQMPMSAAEYICKWAMTEGKDERDAADTFCRQWIDGPQVYIR